jgi:hypothetical protein
VRRFGNWSGGGLLNDECRQNCFRLWVILNINESGDFGHGMGVGSDRCKGLWV